MEHLEQGMFCVIYSKNNMLGSQNGPLENKTYFDATQILSIDAAEKQNKNLFVDVWLTVKLRA